MSKTLRFIVWLALIIMAVGAVYVFIYKKSPTLQEDYMIRVGFKGNSGYQVLFVAEAKDFFVKHGVKIQKQEFESTELMLQAIPLSRIDATPAGNLEAVAKMNMDSPELFKIYLTLVFDKENAFFSLLVSTNSPITSLADLKGKKVGTIPGATATSRLKTCLKKFINPEQVTILQLNPQLQLQALSVGEVDALYTVDPIVTIGQLKGLAKVLIKGPENEYMFTPQATACGVISNDFVRRKPQTTKRFVLAMYDAVDYMRTNEPDTRRIVAAAAKLDVGVAERMALIRYWKVGETDFEAVKKYLNFAVEAGALPSAPKNVRDLYLPENVLK